MTVSSRLGMLGMLVAYASVIHCTAAHSTQQQLQKHIYGLSQQPHGPPQYTCAQWMEYAECDPPNWTPVWQLNASTVAQPCNNSGLFVDDRQWGLLSFDWSNGINVWSKHPNNATTCEEMLVEQACRVKEHNRETKVFVYRNQELALEWLASERAAMLDPSKAAFFMQYQNGSKKGQIYDEPISVGSQYFWNFSNPEAVRYWIDVVVMGKTGMGSPCVDGVFTDDINGVFEEHDQAAKSMGLVQADIDILQKGSNDAWNLMLQTLIKAHGYNWQAFGMGDFINTLPRNTTCLADMKNLCDQQNRGPPARLWGFSNKDLDITQNIAAFLIARGPYWWIGHGWEGCSSTTRPFLPDLINLDVGEPVGNCTVVEPGVYTRRWSKGTATLDCNTFTASLDF